MKEKPVLPFASSMLSWSSYNARHGIDEHKSRRCESVASVDAVANIPLFEIVEPRSTCPYCGTPVRLEEDFEWSTWEGAKGTIDFHVHTARAQQCPHCQWWVLQEFDDNRFINYQSTSLKTQQGVVYEFDMSKYGAPLDVLRQQVLNGDTDLCRISPLDLELLVASALRDLFRCKVAHVGGPGDGGVDLLLVESDTPCLVQVKRRTDARKKEAVSLVRHVLGSMLLFGSGEAIIVSTASDFSHHAQKAVAKALDVAGFRVTLYNQHRLREVLELTAPPNRPWRQRIPKAWLEGNVITFPGGKPPENRGLAGFDKECWDW